MSNRKEIIELKKQLLTYIEDDISMHQKRKKIAIDKQLYEEANNYRDKIRQLNQLKELLSTYE